MVDVGVAAFKAKVLLIHESPVARDALERSLQGRFDVRHAKDAEDAWQSLLVDPSIRAVVASLPVVEIDGYGLLQRVRRSKVPRISGAPVLILSDTLEQAHGRFAISFGASDVLPYAGQNGLPDRLQDLIEPRMRITQPVVSLPSIRLVSVSVPLPIPAVAPPAENFDARLPSSAPNPGTEVSMSRLEDLNKVLKTLQSSSPGVEASALISSDGLMIASALAPEMDGARIAAMAATLLSLGTRAATELRRGEVSEVIVRGEQGYAVMLSAGRGALLLVLATEATPLGLIFFDMREAVKGIKTVL
jgi:predicted regulator of Ras-like GTPase activity (Roadblock/LC7/MglB family)/CheY-like chemotaxis protein